MKKRLLSLGTGQEHLCDLFNHHFDIVPSANIRYRNTTSVTDINFDALLLIDSQETTDIEFFCKLNNIPVIGTKRFTKSVQHLILRKHGIQTPETFFVYNHNNKISDFSLVNLLSYVDDKQQLIIKMDAGARGLGQLFITKKTFVNYALNGFSFKERDSEFDAKNSNSFSYESSNDYYIPEGIGVKVNAPSYIMPQLSRGYYIIQKYVNVAKEYRYLYFNGERPIIIERVKGDDDWQANSCVTGNGNYISSPETEITNFKKIKSKIEELCKELNTPFLSIDLYIDTDGNWGIFEFQMEFGILYVPHDLLLKRITNSITNKLSLVTTK